MSSFNFDPFTDICPSFIRKTTISYIFDKEKTNEHSFHNKWLCSSDKVSMFLRKSLIPEFLEKLLKSKTLKIRAVSNGSFGNVDKTAIFEFESFKKLYTKYKKYLS